jgi:hypothetical protein
MKSVDIEDRMGCLEDRVAAMDGVRAFSIGWETVFAAMAIGIIVGFVLGLLTWTHCPWG